MKLEKKPKTPAQPNKSKRSVKIKFETTFGYHNSERDFPLIKKPSRYPTKSSQNLILNFGEKEFKLPINFLHYIDDVDSIGWSWEPPKDFIQCLREGYKPSKNQVKTQAIGYLVRVRENNSIYDTHGGDINLKEKGTKAKTQKKLTVDKETLAILKEIYQAALKRQNDIESDTKYTTYHYGRPKPAPAAKPVTKGAQKPATKSAQNHSVKKDLDQLVHLKQMVQKMKDPNLFRKIDPKNMTLELLRNTFGKVDTLNIVPQNANPKAKRAKLKN